MSYSARQVMDTIPLTDSIVSTRCIACRIVSILRDQRGDENQSVSDNMGLTRNRSSLQ